MDVARTQEHSAALAKFEGRKRGRRAGDVAPKPREGDSEQGAHDDPDGGLVADEKHGAGAIAMIMPDPIEHREGAPRDLVRALSPRRGRERRVGRPIAERARVARADLGFGATFPSAVGDFAQARLDHGLEPAHARDGLGRLSRPELRTAIQGARRSRDEGKGDELGLGSPVIGQGRVEIPAENSLRRLRRVSVPDEVDREHGDHGSRRRIEWSR
jgi:hypothetical protein